MPTFWFYEMKHNTWELNFTWLITEIHEANDGHFFGISTLPQPCTLVIPHCSYFKFFGLLNFLIICGNSSSRSCYFAIVDSSYSSLYIHIQRCPQIWIWFYWIFCFSRYLANDGIIEQAGGQFLQWPCKGIRVSSFQIIEVMNFFNFHSFVQFTSSVLTLANFIFELSIHVSHFLASKYTSCSKRSPADTLRLSKRYRLLHMQLYMWNHKNLLCNHVLSSPCKEVLFLNYHILP